MEKPITSIHSGRDSALRRRAAAIVSGFNVELADVSLTLRASDHRRASALAERVVVLPPADGEPQLSFAFLDASAAGVALPAREPDERLVGLDVWQGDDTLVARSDGLVLRADGRDAVVGGEADDAGDWLPFLFHLSVAHLLAPLGRFVVHAAAIAQGDRAWLVVGPSGSGKSTVAYAASCHGWLPLGDDLVVLRRAREGVEVMALPRRMAIPRELGPRGYDEPSAQDARDRVGMDAAGDGRWRCVAGTMLVAHGDTDALGLEPAEPSAVFDTLVTSYTPAANLDRLGAYLPVAGALARGRAARLLLHRDPAQRVDGVARALASL